MRGPGPSLLTVMFVVLITSVVAVNGLWIGEKGDGWKDTVRSDVKGYYGYLQAYFIRGDLGHEPPAGEYVQHTPHGTVNKYFCGTSVMMAPWFGIGHALALMDPEAPKDGLSIHEMRALSIGAWVYLLLGLLALRALLLGLGVRESAVAWTLLAIGLGTQLMQYAALQPGWSHVHSFCVIGAFLWVVHRLYRGAPAAWWMVAVLLFGLIVLIRPVNATVVLAVPLLVGKDTWPLLRGLLTRPMLLLGSALTFAAVVGVQPLLWHMQTGQWIAEGYQGEGFHWDRPEVFKVLFGFRRGLFLWAPVLLLAVAGTVVLWRADRIRGLAMVLYWAVNTYVIASWWIWYYGSGFGSRVFVDHYPVLAIPMAMLLNGLRPRWWVAARTFIAACIALLGIQMWQYHKHILHRESMDRKKYAFTFLRTGNAYKDRLGGNYQAPPYNPKGMDVLLEESCDLEHPCGHWSGGRIESHPQAFSGSTVCVFAPDTEFGIAFVVDPSGLPLGRALFLEVGVQRYEVVPGSSHTMLGITEVRRADGTNAYYEPFRMNPLPPVAGRWEQLEYRIPVPPLEAGDRLSFYFWNQGLTAHVLIDDMYMRVSAARPY